MNHLYPLRFQPIFREYLWGGRRLGEVLNKQIGEGDTFAESWEIVDHGADQSVVAFGALSGKTLGDVVAEHGIQLFGQHAPQTQFPLLFKYLDAQRDLSVQVHPNDEQGAKLDPPDLGKTEAWYIVDAKPGSVIYAGLARGYNRNLLAREIERGATDAALHEIEVIPGDCVFIPAGTVHAIGSGLLVAEIQQASDTTFRLFDWNRVDKDGLPRTLHIEQALEVIDFRQVEIDKQIPQPTTDDHIERLVTCEKFVLERWSLNASQPIGGDSRFRIVSVLEGAVSIRDDPSTRPLRIGETCLLPADCQTELTPDGGCVLLVSYLPDSRVPITHA